MGTAPTSVSLVPHSLTPNLIIPAWAQKAPKAGSKTPGVQILFPSLKSEAEFPITGTRSVILIDQSGWIANRTGNAPWITTARFPMSRNGPGTGKVVQ